MLSDQFYTDETCSYTYQYQRYGADHTKLVSNAYVKYAALNLQTGTKKLK
jgi:hypothetical protein